jgi:glycine/D-amino acid oxidase-like deaminating enzyme
VTSFWWRDLPPAERNRLRPPLPGDATVDVAVVGGGYTGLWTAYWLLVADPSLRVLVLEAEHVGHGASGRNGGWCSALFPVPWSSVARRHGRDAAVAMHRALVAGVDDVGAVLAAEGIDAQWAKGGTVVFARNPAQRARAQAEVAEYRELGFGADDLDLVDGAAARRIAGVPDALGALVTPHCAAMHPARLVTGLARAVERRGGVIAERTPGLAIAPGQVRTSRGMVRAEVVVRATEAWTSTLPGMRRSIVPATSAMVVTEPLAADVLDAVGLAQRPTFADLRHVVVYGQRTADGRIAFGGRGTPYVFGSHLAPRVEHVARVHAWLEQELVAMMPALSGVRFDDRWAGQVGIARDWWPSVGLDRRRGMAWAGGYVGEGVTLSFLAGRTLADLVLERDTDLVHLPWVGHRSPTWEPEPLRWLGVNGVMRAMDLADPQEARTGRPSGVAGAAEWLMAASLAARFGRGG